MTVSGVNLSESSVKVFRALEVPVLSASLKRPPVASEALDFFRNLELADQYNTGTELTVDILIGLDVFWQLMKNGKVRCPGGFVAQNTVFGWTVTGAVQCNQQRSATCQLLLMSDVSESALRNFPDRESVGKKGYVGNEPESFLDWLANEYNRHKVAMNLERDTRGRAESQSGSVAGERAMDESLTPSYQALGVMESKGMVEEVPT